jgi:1-acyl-sn-glycerol-3-phosphate acyltransferase
MGKTNTVRRASAFVFFLLRAIFRPFLFFLYRFLFETETSKDIKPPCLILSNHQAAYDQFAVGIGFKFGINFVASDILFRHGLGSWLMKVLVRPIPFSKGNSDFIAVKNIISVIKEGGCVAMFPSGNRSFFGEESTIIYGIGKFVKKLSVPLVLVQIRGGFLTLPRWAASASLGKARASVTRVVRSEELSAMSSEEIDGIIRQEIGYNEYEYNKTAQTAYRGWRKAEYLESALFYCPQCRSITALHSQGNEFFCHDCGARVRINSTGFFERIEKAEKIPGTILEWSRLQLDYIKGFDFSPFMDRPAFSDDNIIFSKAERAMRENRLSKGLMAFYNDKMTVCGKEFFHAETTTAIQGVRKMTIYNKNSVYAVLAPLRTNLVKYMICGYHLRNKILNTKEEYYGY